MGPSYQMPAHCPDARTLQAFALGGLSMDEIEAIGSHLASCEVCQKTLEDLNVPDDSFINDMRLSEESGSEDTDFRWLADRLRQMPTLLTATATFRELQTSGISHEPVPGLLGQYRLLEKIGQGSMGTVYRAWHMKLKREVVVKLLSPKRLNDRHALLRFSREMEAIGKLDDHPNIVRARDAGEIDGHHFLVMDYVEGLDVAHLLCRVGTLSVPDACEIVRQAALGLEYAHQHGVVHRDVKPNNLLLAATGQVKLLDLGLVSFRQDARREAENGVLVGTADYMAPEQWTEGGEVDIRADIYSLGCTLYKLLTGKAPFSDAQRGHRAKMMAHLKASVVPASKRCPAVPAELDAVLSRMLAKAPEERYERPAEVASALEPFVLGSDLAELTRTEKHMHADTGRMTSDVTVGEHRTRLFSRANYLARRWGLAVMIIALPLIFLAVFANLSWFRHAGPEPLFLQQPDTVLWEYQETGDVLHVQSNGFALFRAASTESGSFTIQTTLVQEEWQGGLGIFFGYKEAPAGEASQRTFQTVEFRRTTDARGSYEYQLVRSLVRIIASRSGREACTVDELVSVPLPGPLRGMRHHMHIVIQDGILDRTLWDGKELSGLKIDSADTRSPKVGSRGQLGVFATRGASRFRGTRFYEGEQKSQPSVSQNRGHSSRQELSLPSSSPSPARRSG